MRREEAQQTFIQYFILPFNRSTFGKIEYLRAYTYITFYKSANNLFKLAAERRAEWKWFIVWCFFLCVESKTVVGAIECKWKFVEGKKNRSAANATERKNYSNGEMVRMIIYGCWNVIRGDAFERRLSLICVGMGGVWRTMSQTISGWPLALNDIRMRTMDGKVIIFLGEGGRGQEGGLSSSDFAHFFCIHLPLS